MLVIESHLVSNEIYRDLLRSIEIYRDLLRSIEISPVLK